MKLSEQYAVINRHIVQVPVNVQALAQELGVTVRYAYLDEDISGMLEKTSDDDFIISVNATHPKTRQRFTIAHELGHYMLHRGLVGDGLDDDRAYRSTSAGRYHNTAIGPQEERQANHFAANILMPRRMIERVQQGEGLNSPAALARMFGVSEHSMCIRLGIEYNKA